MEADGIFFNLKQLGYDTDKLKLELKMEKHGYLGDHQSDYC